MRTLFSILINIQEVNILVSQKELFVVFNSLARRFLDSVSIFCSVHISLSRATLTEQELEKAIKSRNTFSILFLSGELLNRNFAFIAS